MGQLTEAMVRSICNFRQDAVTAMLADLNAHEDVDALAAPGALSTSILVSELSVDGTDAFTLAAPTRTGQRKIVRCVAATNTPVGTLTISSPDDTVGYVCPTTFVFDQAGQDIVLEATAALKWRWIGGSIERFTDTIAAPGALSTTRVHSTLAVDGTDAFTLAAPTRVGQRKIVTCVSAANTPLGTLTVSSPDDTAGFVCAAKFLFTAVGQECEFEATAALKWRCVRKKRVGSKTIVIGTDVLTDICNMEFLIRTSTTGTVASLTTKGLPNGSAIGERIEICEITAASTPHGDLAGTFLDHAGAAKTALDDFTAEKDGGTFVWTGAAWQLEGRLTGSALAFT